MGRWLVRGTFILALGLGGATCSAGMLEAPPDSWRSWLPEGSEPAVPYAREATDIDPVMSAEGVSLTRWTRTALDLVVKYQQNGVRASRIFAYLHAAMHDAVADGSKLALSGGELDAGAHLAAAGVLAYFYPQEQDGKFDLLAARWLSETYPGDWAVLMAERAGPRQVADRVVQAVRERARRDGADRVWAISSRPDPFPGMWDVTPPLYAFNPLEALAGEWTPWTLTSGREIPVPPPVPFASDEFWLELDEVVETARSLTPEQKAIAEYWDLDVGSVTPPGVWNLHALALIESQGVSDVQALRLLAALNVAMADAAVACWATKYEWWTLRPISAARARGDVDFAPSLATPPHPSYVSGHAAISGAAAVVLTAMVPEFTEQFDTMAEQAAESRLLGGIHFRSDNEEGLKLGRQVGYRVLAALRQLAVHRDM